MIHTLIKLERPLLVFDLETTGLNTNEARIAEIGFQKFTAEGMTKEWRTLVRPGVPMPKEASDAHHLTDEILNGCQSCGFPEADHGIAKTVGEYTTALNCVEFKPWPTFLQLAPHLLKGFVNCDFAGKNIRYDLRIMASEMNRAGIAWSYLGARIIDADRLEQLGVPRTLSHLYKKYTGKTLEDAHHALADVQGTVEVICAQLRTHQTIPRDLDALHEAQWPGWIDTEGKFKFVDGVPIITFGKFAGKPMSIVDNGYWGWLIKSDFSMDIKEIARDAMSGVYPKPKG